jgi:hypothetical protein
MAEKPILFNTDMVRAIMDGRKTVTRRVIKPQPTYEDAFWKLGGAGWSDNINSLYPVPGHSLYNRMPYKPEDILYVRETWELEEFYDNGAMIKYRAGGELPIDYDYEGETYYKLLKFAEDGWIPSLHMPKEAARIWLRVTDVRVERLQDITEEQAKAEGGIDNRGFIHSYDNEHESIHTGREDFVKIWDSTIKKSDLNIYGWEANPWVWVIEFEQCDKPKGVENMGAHDFTEADKTSEWKVIPGPGGWMIGCFECKNCGYKSDDDKAICPGCGAKMKKVK